MPQQSTHHNHNIPGEKLIYERAAGIVYARYANPALRDIPRWIIGGNPEGFIPGTGMPKPEEWWEIEDPLPDWTLIQQHKKLRDMYTAFLTEQEKYKTWEKLSGQR
jgi:hypothetical protein